MAELAPCASCSELVASGTCVCPLCGEKACTSRRAVTGAAVILGLSLAVTGCGGDKDSDSTITSPQPEYGVPTTMRAAPEQAPIDDYQRVLRTHQTWSDDG